jgi:hypothetical protein
MLIVISRIHYTGSGGLPGADPVYCHRTHRHPVFPSHQGNEFPLQD